MCCATCPADTFLTNNSFFLTNSFSTFSFQVLDNSNVYLISFFQDMDHNNSVELSKSLLYHKQPFLRDCYCVPIKENSHVFYQIFIQSLLVLQFFILFLLFLLLLLLLVLAATTNATPHHYHHHYLLLLLPAIADTATTDLSNLYCEPGMMLNTLLMTNL